MRTLNNNSTRGLATALRELCGPAGPEPLSQALATCIFTIPQIGLALLPLQKREQVDAQDSRRLAGRVVEVCPKDAAAWRPISSHTNLRRKSRQRLSPSISLTGKQKTWMAYLGGASEEFHSPINSTRGRIGRLQHGVGPGGLELRARALPYAHVHGKGRGLWRWQCAVHLSFGRGYLPAWRYRRRSQDCCLPALQEMDNDAHPADLLWKLVCSVYSARFGSGYRRVLTPWLLGYVTIVKPSMSAPSKVSSR